MRLLHTTVLVALLAGVFASVAAAGGYTDASYITPIGKVGVPYSHRVEWKPGTGCPPYTYAVVGGEFPPGLTLSSSGYITGTPTKAGTYSFYIRQTDQCGPEGEGNAPFVITIQPGAPPQPPLVLATTSLAPAEAGSAYSATLSSSGGSSYTYSLASGVLPSGLTLSANGVISGTPTAAGTFTFTISVTDQSGRKADRQLTLEVKAPLAIVAPVVPGAEARRHLDLQLSATGGTGPYRWSMVSALPGSVFLDPTTGRIAGAPAEAGEYDLSVAVTDLAGATKTLTFHLTVVQKLHFVTRDKLPNARVGKLYRSRIVVAGGLRPVAFQIVKGVLPTGLALNAKTGVVSGRTSVRGVFWISVSARDALGLTSTRYRLSVR